MTLMSHDTAMSLLIIAPADWSGIPDRGQDADVGIRPFILEQSWLRNIV